MLKTAFAGLIALGLLAGAASAGASPVPGNGAMRKVIVLLHDRPDQGVRAEVRPVAQGLRSSGARHVISGTSLPFVVASVSTAQEAALKSNPAVQAVFPDTVIPAPTAPIPAGAQLVPALGTRGAASAGPCGTAGKPEADPEALAVIHAPAALKLGFDGAGVSVAYIAGPIDTTIPDFKRNSKYASSGSAAGSPVLTNVNFAGDPANTPSGDDAGESFLDASSIVAQGDTVFDLNDFVGTTHPLPHPCDITVTGTAPGASLMGLDVFSSNNVTTESNFIQAIQYAVANGVKVLNESFGGNPFPDSALDATRIVDDDAVAAGVTVVTSTGDSGVTSTVGSPATDPKLISAGASTTFRAYKQLTFGGINATSPRASKGTWLDNNIATISSGGFSQAGDSTVDLVAPGDSNWALCSPNTTVYTACTTFFGTPTGLQFTGGTSESAPLTAGAAADVIQAYEKTHHADPSPALVKQILMSTATDLKAPAEQQGAGLLNIGAAVKEAESINLSTHRTGSLLLSPNQIDVTRAAGAATSEKIGVTNTGSKTVTVSLSTRTLTKKVASHGGSFCLNPSSAKIKCGRPTKRSFKIWSGITEVYQEETFSVPKTGKKQSRLNFSANYPFTNQASLLHVALYDPKGAYAGYSDPQGEANYANVQVTDPRPGTWTAVFFTQKGNPTSQGTAGTTGTIKWRADTWTYGPGGTIKPASLTIKPGKSKTATFKAKSSKAAGDVAQSIVLKSKYGTNSIPVTVRTLVKLGAKGGSFKGLLTGGNGRGNPAQMNTYAFNVPSGKHDLDVSATLADSKDTVVAFLQDPEGETVASSSNVTLNFVGSVVGTDTVDVYKDNPEAGRWTFVLDWLPPVVSATAFAELSEPFSGKVQFNQVKATSTLPSGATLNRGQSYTFNVTVKNTATTPQAFFLDPRAPGSTTLQLPNQNPDHGDQNMVLPLPAGDGTTIPNPFYLVPPETTELDTSLTGSAPVTYDIDPIAGDPDVSPALTSPGVTASQSGNSAALNLTTSGELAPGLWGLFPSEFGPYSAAGAPPVTASAGFKAVTQNFDSTVTASTGDLWSLFNNIGAGNFSPRVLQPGQSVTIPLTIVPSATPGTQVSGTINVDDVFEANALTGFEFAGGDELAALPFTYTVG